MSVFIPKQYRKEPITVRMEFDELERVDQLAASFGLSRSEFINQCIDYALGHMPPPDSKADKPPGGQTV